MIPSLRYSPRNGLTCQVHEVLSNVGSLISHHQCLANMNHLAILCVVLLQWSTISQPRSTSTLDVIVPCTEELKGRQAIMPSLWKHWRIVRPFYRSMAFYCTIPYCTNCITRFVPDDPMSHDLYRTNLVAQLVPDDLISHDLYCTILYCTTLYCTTLYCTILYHMNCIARFHIPHNLCHTIVYHTTCIARLCIAGFFIARTVSHDYVHRTVSNRQSYIARFVLHDKSHDLYQTIVLCRPIMYRTSLYRTILYRMTFAWRSAAIGLGEALLCCPLR